MGDLPFCPLHPEAERPQRCPGCGRPFCERCQEGINEGEPRCPDCFAAEATLFADGAEWIDWPDLL